MDNSSADSYLHKKFKKQLSIVESSRAPPPPPPPLRRNDDDDDDVEKKKKKAGGAVGVVEEEEETTTASSKIEEAVDDVVVVGGGGDGDRQKRKDNNESVPNQSTNNSNQQQNCSSSLSSSPSNLLLLSTSSKSSISAEDRVQSTCISFEPKSWTNAAAAATEDQPPRIAAATTSSSSSILLEEAQPPPDRAGAAAGKYVCTYCNLVCSKPSVLQKHIRAHTNERPYPCNSCGFSFKTRSNLYKHCRSRTHANRVMGNKVQEVVEEAPAESRSPPASLPPPPTTTTTETAPEPKNKPYKPRFHSKQHFFNNNSCLMTKENMEQDEGGGGGGGKHNNSTLLSDHINDIINKNNSIVNSVAADPYLLKRRSSEVVLADNNNEHVQRHIADILYLNAGDEPLNLTNKNRKRCMSEVVEPVAQKSLIKELLLKNLNSDMQCPHCKMIFQTVTELELHKLRSCKGFVKPGAKYSRSSSVNVASILTQNKNAFDNIPHLQNAVFPLKSPGPFLGKTRLVESDKNKSFSFDDGLPAVAFPPPAVADRYLLSPLTLPSVAAADKEKKAPPVKLFGGEVKITHTSGETKSFKIDGKEADGNGSGGGGGFGEFAGGKVSENRVVKSGLQSGGTVLTNKASYPKQEQLGPGAADVIRVYEATPVSPSIDISKAHFRQQQDSFTARTNADLVQRTADLAGVASPSYKYTNIMDFSQKAVKLLTPNLKQPNLAVPGVPAPNKFTFPATFDEPKAVAVVEPENLTTPKMVPSPFQPKIVAAPAAANLYNPMKLLVNGKVVRYVPGIPGPVAADEPLDMAYGGVARLRPQLKPNSPPPPPPPPPPATANKMEALEVKTDLKSPSKPAADKSPVKVSVEAAKVIGGGETKKFARPNSLALKPTTASLKQHHGLTPTMFNQILISPDTPRVAKKYVQQFLHGNYFSYLGLKSSTKPVYCTLNKTQPFYVPHFKKLSMYSEWRQQDTKTEKLFVSGYDSRQRHARYTTAGKATADLVVHSSYKFVVSESSSNSEKNEEQQKSATILGGYECNDDYTYIRGRGRGRYVCDQCGIRCKKPSMLKKHIRTHSNDRPYTCSHCNFSFKTKGNLTKHMKSKAHTKNYAASGSGSSTQQSGTQSSESETEDSGMDSSDESTRREEHEAAYGLLSLSQKTSSQPLRRESNSPTSSVGSSEPPLNIMNSEEIAHVSKTTYAKNKILDEKTPLNFSAPKTLPTTTTIAAAAAAEEEAQNVSQFLGRTSVNRPLTYPYTSVLPPPPPSDGGDGNDKREIKQFHVIQKYAPPSPSSEKAPKEGRTRVAAEAPPPPVKVNSVAVPPPVLKINDAVVLGGGSGDGQSVITDLRKRKFGGGDYEKAPKLHRGGGDEVMDLSMPAERAAAVEVRYNGSPAPDVDDVAATYHVIKKKEQVMKSNGNFIVLAPLPSGDVNINYVIQQPSEQRPLSRESRKSVEYDNSAMETLADIATKQVKLEKNTMAKSVASEFLKIATKNEDGAREAVAAAAAYGPVTKEVNDLIVKPEGNKSCHICAKSFNKMSQLRLHLNIHYLERPFRCHSCSVSFRTKGHLQKHERSASHHNKLSSSPALSSSEPRPFKCIDCNIAFRIHGHLAKHLRSKMHIMKLECLAKIPFGLYAELERSNSLLTEINTADGDQCLESLKTLAKKVFINDPNKLNQLNSVENLDADS